MRILKNSIAIVGLIYLALPYIGAQSNTLSTGGDASAASGSVSYSIGQIDYVSATAASGTINQGLQQPFEFYIITGTHEDNMYLKVIVFPNPADYFISLVIDLDDLSNLQYQLYNFQAQLMEGKNILSRNTHIDMRSLMNGSYIIKISRNQHVLKSFKIIKNQ